MPFRPIRLGLRARRQSRRVFFPPRRVFPAPPRVVPGPRVIPGPNIVPGPGLVPGPIAPGPIPGHSPIVPSGPIQPGHTHIPHHPHQPVIPGTTDIGDDPLLQHHPTISPQSRIPQSRIPQIPKGTLPGRGPAPITSIPKGTIPGGPDPSTVDPSRMPSAPGPRGAGPVKQDNFHIVVPAGPQLGAGRPVVQPGQTGSFQGSRSPLQGLSKIILDPKGDYRVAGGELTLKGAVSQSLGGRRIVAKVSYKNGAGQYQQHAGLVDVIVGGDGRNIRFKIKGLDPRVPYQARVQLFEESNGTLSAVSQNTDFNLATLVASNRR